jgi:hypothetical protein
MAPYFWAADDILEPNVVVFKTSNGNTNDRDLSSSDNGHDQNMRFDDQGWSVMTDSVNTAVTLVWCPPSGGHHTRVTYYRDCFSLHYVVKADRFLAGHEQQDYLLDFQYFE